MEPTKEVIKKEVEEKKEETKEKKEKRKEILYFNFQNTKEGHYLAETLVLYKGCIKVKTKWQTSHTQVNVTFFKTIHFGKDSVLRCENCYIQNPKCNNFHFVDKITEPILSIQFNMSIIDTATPKPLKVIQYIE